MLDPYSRTFDDTYLSMEYWYEEIQKLRGFGCNSSPGGEGVLRGTFVHVLLYIVTCLAVQVDVTIQFVWRDSGYVHAGTIRTWIRTPDMDTW